MLTLAIDTATNTASCALAEDGKIISELSIQHGKTHSQKLMPMIKSVLSMCGRNLCDIDLYAVAIGPGSFTGLRIGVVTIKGLAYSLNKPVCGIPTLDSLAYSVPDFDGVLAPILDARNNQVFTALYKKQDNDIYKLTSDLGIHIDELIELLKSQDKKIMILGDAVPLHINRIKAAMGDMLFVAEPALVFPRAASTAVLAEKAFYQNNIVNAFELEPLYLRKSQAERMKGTLS